MATADGENTTFPNQIEKSRHKIRHAFMRLHEALRVRESSFLSRVDQIEKDYYSKTQEIQNLLDALNNIKSINSDTLNSNKATDTQNEISASIDKKIAQLIAESDNSIEFEWNNLFESSINELGSIILNGQAISPACHPTYKAKHLPAAYGCKKSSYMKAPGDLNCPTSIAMHYKTGAIYIADKNHNCVRIFLGCGAYFFTFSEKMNAPRGICISQNNVYVTQCGSHCVNMYELGGRLIKSVGSRGNRLAQFNNPHGIDVSERNSYIYICDTDNKRVLILTKELKFDSILGIGLFKYPLDVKVASDRVLVLDCSDLCMSVFNSDHVLTNRLITRGSGKQTNNPLCFDVDMDYNVIMSDYNNHCVYIFNQEGEPIHTFGKEGQGIGEFINPYGIVLDNMGHIIVVCEKDYDCLQFF